MNWHTNLIVNDQRYTFIDLAKVAADFNAELKRLPYSIRVLLESVARHQDLLGLFGQLER